MRHIQVASEYEGQRLDNFLLRELKGLPRTRVYRLLRQGQVRVNGGRVRPEYRLRRGDRLRLPPMRLQERELGGAPSARILQRIEQAILYENEQLLILDKPSGLAVHGGSGLAYGVIEAIRARRPGTLPLDLAHRLDRDTSGCLIIAKRRETLRQIHALMRSNRVEKRYLALLRGKLASAMRVEAPLERRPGQGLLQPVQVSIGGRQALTVFHPIERHRGWTLVDVMLHTGRMHQIRVHAAYSGYPVAGDARYGDPQANRTLRRFGLRRLFLHASRVAFALPGQDKLVVQAALSEELAAVLQYLRENASAEGGAR
ncbi:ribosomal large subunit pseudouridine synthase C [Nitrococcus mobilis Nb-231]|uniref:Pseudouridine synthase n=1 Tax=Nitrococcus mobilis Nb-231 TaxID=314278 RepID=A4BML3_9GAMM|nr:ribosomal large subunit pseudouridine synthase C [Nitrococcus mobilis Nb-231]